MLNTKKVVAESLDQLIGSLDAGQIFDMLETPPDPEMGDVALPCFKLSKVLRKAPAQIAADLAERYPGSELIERVEAKSGYLNFFLNKTAFVEKVLIHILDEKDRYGSSNVGQGRTIVLDYSAPNIAKPFHVGHLFTTVIGNSLYKIFNFMGYKSVGINHLGDWGTQFGKMIVAYKKWGSKEKVEQGQVKELMALYVRFHEEAEKDPSLDDQARAWFTRLERGDKEARELWQWFVEISLKEFKKVYELLDVEFDSYAGESFYNDKMEPVVEEIREKGLLRESEGAQIVDLEQYGMPPCIILKKDGSTLYATRDITAALYRKKTYNFDKCLYVTGASQTLHFQQWFKVIELMGYKWAEDLHHIPFGTVSIGGEKLATRKGKVVLLDDLFAEATRKTLELIQAKSPDMENKEDTARQIGIGAVIFSYLSSNRIKDISFSWEEVLNFDGETGPYVQYTHARTCSLMQKAGGEDVAGFDAGVLGSRQEYELVKTLYLFPQRIELAVQEYEPSIITRYLVDLAQDFNRFYHEHFILVEDPAVRKARLALVEATRYTLANGLKLIGLSAPERV